MFNKETAKRRFLAFPGNGCKDEKNVSSITKILLDSNYHRKTSSKNFYFEKKRPEVKKHLCLNFMTTFIKHLHFMTTFHSLTLKKKLVELQGC